MSTLIRESISTAKSMYECDDCKESIHQGDKYSYLYGSAHKHELPYALRICANCKSL